MLWDEWCYFIFLEIRRAQVTYVETSESNLRVPLWDDSPAREEEIKWSWLPATFGHCPTVFVALYCPLWFWSLASLASLSSNFRQKISSLTQSFLLSLFSKSPPVAPCANYPGLFRLSLKSSFKQTLRGHETSPLIWQSFLSFWETPGHVCSPCFCCCKCECSLSNRSQCPHSSAALESHIQSQLGNIKPPSKMEPIRHVIIILHFPPMNWSKYSFSSHMSNTRTSPYFLP